MAAQHQPSPWYAHIVNFLEEECKMKWKIKNEVEHTSLKCGWSITQTKRHAFKSKSTK
ncbi:unnamed protein product [Spirodela intermedia]|uniref:Uncharacterized protein n=1 Tax=Spirodela intermedia TaxID=51605 RepID=A0A7I8LCP5_SPIIN|nr:unnamed protein product [Spirodela intermedia]